MYLFTNFTMPDFLYFCVLIFTFNLRARVKSMFKISAQYIILYLICYKNGKHTTIRIINWKVVSSHIVLSYQHLSILKVSNFR